MNSKQWNKERAIEDQYLSLARKRNRLSLTWKPSRRTAKSMGKGVGDTHAKHGGIINMKFKPVRRNEEYIY